MADRLKRLKPSHWLSALAGLAVVALVIGILAAPRDFFGEPAAPDTVAFVDTDGDGIPDGVETGGWVVASGALYVTDPTSADTDGDGLSDSEEAGGIVSAPGDPAVYIGVTDPTKADSDGDGINDRIEMAGWIAAAGASFTTDPMNPDVDGDGLLDGEEAGTPSGSSASVFTGYSNPTATDTDGDGLTDVEEADASTNPMLADSDSDTLDDYQEVVILGSDPLSADTDGDTFDDAFEVANAEELGFDLLFFDEKVSKWDYATDFAIGALAGEAWPVGSDAWAQGYLSASLASFIPGVGWLIGNVGDVRDAIALSIQGDWVGSGYSLIGLIPAVGDYAALITRIEKVARVAKRLLTIIRAVIAKMKNMPDKAKLLFLKAATPDWDFLIDKGATAAHLLTLSQHGNVDFEGLAATLKRPGCNLGYLSPLLNDNKAGELSLGQSLSAPDLTVKPNESFSTRECTNGCNEIRRRTDQLVDGVAHEAKVGFVISSQTIRQQIASDGFLVRNGDIQSATWHFYPSSKNGTLGAAVEIFDLLDANNIQCVIHLS